MRGSKTLILNLNLAIKPKDALSFTALLEMASFPIPLPPFPGQVMDADNVGSDDVLITSKWASADWTASPGEYAPREAREARRERRGERGERGCEAPPRSTRL